MKYLLIIFLCFFLMSCKKTYDIKLINQQTGVELLFFDLSESDVNNLLTCSYPDRNEWKYERI